MKKCYVVFVILGVCMLIAIVGILVLSLKIMPELSMKNARRLLDGFSPLLEYSTDNGNRYYARYELNESEWQDIETQLGGFEKRDNDSVVGPMEKLFTQEEMDKVIAAFYDSNAIPCTFKRRYCNVSLAAVPSDNGVSVFFYVMLPSYGL